MEMREMLMANENQHKAKNTISKFTDKVGLNAGLNVVEYLSKKYPDHTFVLPHTPKKSRKFQLSDYCKYMEGSFAYDEDTYGKNKEKGGVEPDGGIIWMDGKYPILITEMKTQGSLEENPDKKGDGGNAFERLGKYLVMFGRMYAKLPIFPIVVFCAGGAFHDNGDAYFQAVCMNGGKSEYINRTFLSTDIEKDENYASILCRQDKKTWTEEEMIPYMISIAEDAMKIFIS